MTVNAVTESKYQIPSCIDLIFHWRRCSAFSNHFHHYYIYGDFPNCEFEKENIKKCFRYKASKSEGDKKEFMEVAIALSKKENFQEKSSIDVWEFRENPAADWK